MNRRVPVSSKSGRGVFAFQPILQQYTAILDMAETRVESSATLGLDNAVVTQSIRHYWQIVSILFILAAVLRCSLAVYNREANDNHYEVVKLILAGRNGLTMADCHECFHPKLFYYVCAAVVRILGLTTESSRIVGGQLLNSAAGLLTLSLVFMALNASQFQPRWRLWTFALIALNPRFIAINGQLSNDSFAILFATTAIFLTMRLLQAPTLRLAVVTQVALSCALMTKGTTWVVPIAILIIFLLRSFLEESKKQSRWFAGLYVATALNCFVSIQLAGYDFVHYDVYANKGRGHPLYLWEKTIVGRPGVQSIVDGYFTFRIVDLILDPQIARDPQLPGGVRIGQRHCTSVWTQLYARTNFAQYEQHPASWLTTKPYVIFIARCSYVLGLLPLLFLLVGLARGILRSLHAWKSFGMPQPGNYASLFSLLVCLGYIAFIIKFTADYRDFAAMKLIYILPGVLPFAYALLEGMQTAIGQRCHVRFVGQIVHCSLLCLLILHCAGIAALVAQLANR